VNLFSKLVKHPWVNSLCSVCDCTDERDWKNLLPKLVTKVAELALRSDVTDYIRLRAVCMPWRSAPIVDPKLMGMMPRFYPRNWEMVHKGKRVARKP
jgi:hypothetical protein